MTASVFGPVSGTSLPVRCVSFSCCCCCCCRFLWSSCSTRVLLHSFSARSGSPNLRCLNCVLVSHVCSGVIRSLPVRVHPTQAIWRCFEGQLHSAFRAVVNHALRDFLDFPSENFATRSASLQTLIVTSRRSRATCVSTCPNIPCTRPWRHATYRYRIPLQCNLEFMPMISGHALHAQCWGFATHSCLEFGLPLDNAITVCVFDAALINIFP